MTQRSKRQRWFIGASALVVLGLGAAALFASLRLSVRDPFDRDASGLPAATGTKLVELADGATFNGVRQ